MFWPAFMHKSGFKEPRFFFFSCKGSGVIFLLVADILGSGKNKTGPDYENQIRGYSGFTKPALRRSKTIFTEFCGYSGWFGNMNHLIGHGIGVLDLAPKHLGKIN